MKRDLVKALGKNYALEGNNIVNLSVKGFDSQRNFAQVREVKGKLLVNKFNPEKGWYKGEDEKSFDNVETALEYLNGKVKAKA